MHIVTHTYPFSHTPPKTTKGRGRNPCSAPRPASFPCRLRHQPLPHALRRLAFIPPPSPSDGTACEHPSNPSPSPPCKSASSPSSRDPIAPFHRSLFPSKLREERGKEPKFPREQFGKNYGVNSVRNTKPVRIPRLSIPDHNPRPPYEPSPLPCPTSCASGPR